MAQFGMLRLVRDVCHMNGLILFDHTFRVRQMILNRDDPLAKKLCAGLAALLAQEHVAVTLGEI